MCGGVLLLPNFNKESVGRKKGKSQNEPEKLQIFAWEDFCIFRLHGPDIKVCKSE